MEFTVGLYCRLDKLAGSFPVLDRPDVNTKRQLTLCWKELPSSLIAGYVIFGNN
jgi:hypothetical protein